MSTILKALRRLEEDGTIEATSSAGSLPATDPQASNELRSRILAEELAAEANGLDSVDPSNPRKPILIVAAIATVAALIVGIGIGFYSPLTGDEAEPAFAASPPGTLNSLAVAVDPRNPTHAWQEPMPIEDSSTFAANDPRPATPDVQPVAPAALEEMPLAAVTPTPAVLASKTAAANPASPRPERSASSMRTPTPSPTPIPSPTLAPPRAPTPIRTTRSPARPSPTPTERRATHSEVAVSAPNPPTKANRESVAAARRNETRAANPRRDEPSSESTAEPSPKAPARSRPAAPVATQAKSEAAAEVEEHDHRGLPDIAVVRTAWHPNPSRRSAKIRMMDTKEILTLKEGDAVGGLVIQEISPSAILFLSGDIEIRLRVGQPGSGG